MKRLILIAAAIAATTVMSGGTATAAPAGSQAAPIVATPIGMAPPPGYVL